MDINQLRQAIFSDDEAVYKVLLDLYQRKLPHHMTSLVDMELNTPLHHVARSQNLRYGKILVLLGCDPNRQNARRQTPFDVAMNHRNEIMIRWLLSLPSLSVEQLNTAFNPSTLRHLSQQFVDELKTGIPIDKPDVSVNSPPAILWQSSEQVTADKDSWMIVRENDRRPCQKGRKQRRYQIDSLCSVT